MFESTCYINEKDLLETLALEKLKKKAATLTRHWKWVDVSLSEQGTTEYKGRLQAEYVKVPETLTNELAETQKALDVLNEKDFEAWSEDDEALEETLENALTKLENKREKYRQFTTEQRAVSGAVVSFDREGKIVVTYGYVKKEDMVSAFPASCNDGETDHREPNSNGIESNALKNDLDNFKLQALQSQIMKDDKLTYDLMVFALAKTVLNQNGYCSKPLDVAISIANLSATKGIEETQAYESMTTFNKDA